MQSVQLLNMLESARNRAANQARMVSETKAAHDVAVAKTMLTTAKKLRAQLKRQEMALALTNEEVRELETALKEEGDLITPAKPNANKR